MIKLSKKWDYGLRAISYLATHKWKQIKIFYIAKELWVSETFLRRIINDFEKAHLITTIKWRNGGVFFEKESREVSLYDIFLSLGEDLVLTDCTGWIFCKNEEKCITNLVLLSIQKWFLALLKIYTLDKIIKK